MLKLKTILFIILTYTQAAYALVSPNLCNVIPVYNNTEDTIEITGTYPDTKEVMKPMLLKAGVHQDISLGTLRTCGGNNKKIHCHAMWVQCHKQLILRITHEDMRLLLFHEEVHEGDTLSINQCPTCDTPWVVLVNGAKPR